MKKGTKIIFLHSRGERKIERWAVKLQRMGRQGRFNELKKRGLV